MKVTNLREAVNFFYGPDYGSMLNSTGANRKLHDVYLKLERELFCKFPFVGQIGHNSEDGLVTNFFSKFDALDSSQSKSDKVNELLSIVNKLNESFKSIDGVKTSATNLEALTGASYDLIDNILSIEPDLSGSDDMAANEFFLSLLETQRNKFIEAIENAQKNIAERCLAVKGNVIFNGQTFIVASSNGKFSINFTVKLYCNPNDNNYLPPPLNLNFSFEADSYNDLIKNSNKYVLFANELIEKITSSNSSLAKELNKKAFRKIGFWVFDSDIQSIINRINREAKKIREEFDSSAVDFTLSGDKSNVKGGLFVKGDFFATIKF